MRSLTAPQLAAIDSGLYPCGLCLRLDVVGAPTGLWTGPGDLVVAGFTYHGAGKFLDFVQIDTGVDLSASPLDARLSSNPEVEVAPDVLASIDDYSYKNQPAYLSIVYFDRATGAIATSLLLWQGYIDRIDHDEQVGGEYALVARLEPASLDHARAGYRMRSDADQRLIDADDGFFKFVATVPGQEILYGRTKDKVHSGEDGKGGGKGGHP